MATQDVRAALRGLMAVVLGMLSLATPGLAQAQSSLDSPEAAAMADAQFRLAVEPQAYAAPIGTMLGWANPVSGSRGTVMPVAEYRRDKTGPICRDLNETVDMGGRIIRGVATGCREDGAWRTVQTSLAVPVYPSDVPADLDGGPQQVPIAPVQIYGTIPGNTTAGSATAGSAGASNTGGGSTSAPRSTTFGGTAQGGTAQGGTALGGTALGRTQLQR